MFRMLILSCALLLVVDCGLAQTEEDFSEAIEIVNETLKDPESAQFRELRRVVNTRGTTVVCGEYNARNSYGGYVGYEPFAIIDRYLMTGLEDAERSGCYGEELELYRLQELAKASLVSKFQEEAEFGCGVVWTLLDNHFRLKEDVGDAIDAAIRAMKVRASANKTDISADVEKLVRAQLQIAVNEVAKERATARGIRTGSVDVKLMWESTCKMKALQEMQAAAGLY